MSSVKGTTNYTFADGVNQPLTYKTLGPKVWVLGGIMVVTAIVTCRRADSRSATSASSAGSPVVSIHPSPPRSCTRPSVTS